MDDQARSMNFLIAMLSFSLFKLVTLSRGSMTTADRQKPGMLSKTCPSSRSLATEWNIHFRMSTSSLFDLFMIVFLTIWSIFHNDPMAQESGVQSGLSHSKKGTNEMKR
jgi:hypothetical protein